jgi:aspartyl-tRNA(Asn)/glutamyl-tRNA(Gln) amidotransferase subunit A
MESEILSIHNSFKERDFSCYDLVAGKIGALRDSSYNTANFILEDLALKMASEVDRKINDGEEIGILEGIPFGIKDVFLLQGHNASGSSKFLKDYISPYTATAIKKLMDAGAIPIVKENCDCFGHGSTSENTFFGPVKNALDENLVAGGSSGGSAVNVAKGFTIFSIGGDTGGSIRQPASFNRVFGLKPTYGRVSRYGLMAYASSTDCVGPLARNLEDIRIILNEISGRDPRDLTTIDSIRIPHSIFNEDIATGEFCLGYYKSFLTNENIDPGIKKSFEDIISKIRKEGITVKELEFLDTRILVSTYYALAMAETASNLARLDGTTYGNRIQGEGIKDDCAISRSENFTEETKRRIVGGTQVLSHGYSQGIYTKAKFLLRQIQGKFESDFSEVNLIISPVTPKPAPRPGESLKDPLLMYLSDAYTVGFSLGQLPTLTCPFGQGIQLTADKSNEAMILKFAHFLKGIV